MSYSYWTDWNIKYELDPKDRAFHSNRYRWSMAGRDHCGRPNPGVRFDERRMDKNRAVWDGENPDGLMHIVDWEYNQFDTFGKTSEASVKLLRLTDAEGRFRYNAGVGDCLKCLVRKVVKEASTTFSDRFGHPNREGWDDRRFYAENFGRLLDPEAFRHNGCSDVERVVRSLIVPPVFKDCSEDVPDSVKPALRRLNKMAKNLACPLIQTGSPAERGWIPRVPDWIAAFKHLWERYSMDGFVEETARRELKARVGRMPKHVTKTEYTLRQEGNEVTLTERTRVVEDAWGGVVSDDTRTQRYVLLPERGRNDVLAAAHLREIKRAVKAGEISFEGNLKSICAVDPPRDDDEW